MVLAIILILLIWALWFFGPAIRRWLMRRSINYVQDRMFRNMGIDPAQARAQQSEQTSGSARKRSRSRQGWHSAQSRKIIPADYGEPVNFEILAITGSEKWLIDTDKSPVFVEYRKEIQITDVQYVIIP